MLGDVPASVGQRRVSAQTLSHQNMNAAHRKRRCDDVSGVAPVGKAIALDQWARQYGWHDRDAEEEKTRAECDRYEGMIEKTRAERDRYDDDRRMMIADGRRAKVPKVPKWLMVPKWLTEELRRAEGELKRLKVEHKDHMRTLIRLKVEHKDHMRTLVEDADLYDENYHRLVLTKTMVQDMLDECMGSSVNLKRCLEKLVPPVIRVVKRPAAFVSRW